MGMKADRHSVETLDSEQKSTGEENEDRLGMNINSVITEGDKDVLIIRDFDEIKVVNLVAYDVIIIDYSRPVRAMEMISQIRTSAYGEIYLKPIFLLAQEQQVDSVVKELVDGVLNQPTIELEIDRVNSMLTLIEEITHINSDFKGRKMLLKLLRFLYIRDKEFVPVASPKSHVGYAFPFLDVHIRPNNYTEVLDILETGDEKDLLTGEFVDGVHLCSNCSSAFINYREICPKCSSKDVFSQNTIHHFICGNVGPEKDFMVQGKLKCPKCDRLLRHIGVDYDKPSVIIECINGHIFQETDIQTFCFNCKEVAKVEELNDYHVHSYKLTASGVDTAKSGTQKKAAESQLLDGFVSLSVFKTFLRMEVERNKITSEISSISYINILMSPKTLKVHQDAPEEFFNELARIIKTQLKTSEIVTLVNDDTLLILSPAETVEEVKSRMNEVTNAGLKLVQHSLSGNENDRLLTETFDIGDTEGDETFVFAAINRQIHML